MKIFFNIQHSIFLGCHIAHWVEQAPPNVKATATFAACHSPINGEKSPKTL